MQKILIINPFGIGDVLFTTPLVKAVKVKLPDSFVGYLCNRQVEPILKNNPYINELFFYSRGDFKKIKRGSCRAHIKSVFKALSRLKKIGFDSVIDLSMVSQYSFLLWLIGVPIRAGFDYKQRGYFLNKKILINGFIDKHVVDYYFDLLDKLGIDRPERKIECYLDKKDVEWADNFLKTNKLNPEHLLIGISPFGGASWGSSAESKHWPSECFFSIAQNIAKDYKARIILFGSSQEEGDCVRFKPIIDRTNIIDACGKTSLGQLAALISRLKLLIGNDSGILHLASAFDVRTVSIFGPVDEKVYGPLGSLGHHIVVTKDLPCRPCYRDFKIPGCQTMGCLKQITEDDVLAAVARLI